MNVHVELSRVPSISSAAAAIPSKPALAVSPRSVTEGEAQSEAMDPERPLDEFDMF